MHANLKSMNVKQLKCIMPVKKANIITDNQLHVVLIFFVKFPCNRIPVYYFRLVHFVSVSQIARSVKVYII